MRYDVTQRVIKRTTFRRESKRQIKNYILARREVEIRAKYANDLMEGSRKSLKTNTSRTNEEMNIRNTPTNTRVIPDAGNSRYSSVAVDCTMDVKTISCSIVLAFLCFPIL